MNVRILDVISLGCLRVRVNVRMHVCILVRVCQDVLRAAYCVRACVRVRVCLLKVLTQGLLLPSGACGQVCIRW